MVKNVDDINRFYEAEIATHLKVAAILRQEEFFRLEAYDHTTFYTLESPQNIGKVWVDEIKAISPQRPTNEITQAGQTFNSTFYPDKTWVYPATIYNITSPILVHNTSETQQPR